MYFHSSSSVDCILVFLVSFLWSDNYLLVSVSSGFFVAFIIEDLPLGQRFFPIAWGMQEPWVPSHLQWMWEALVLFRSWNFVKLIQTSGPSVSLLRGIVWFHFSGMLWGRQHFKLCWEGWMCPRASIMLLYRSSFAAHRIPFCRLSWGLCSYVLGYRMCVLLHIKFE